MPGALVSPLTLRAQSEHRAQILGNEHLGLPFSPFASQCALPPPSRPPSQGSRKTPERLGKRFLSSTLLRDNSQFQLELPFCSQIECTPSLFPLLCGPKSTNSGHKNPVELKEGPLTGLGDGFNIDSQPVSSYRRTRFRFSQNDQPASWFFCAQNLPFS